MPPPGGSALEAALRTLDSSGVRLEAPRQMWLDQAARVSLRVARRTALPAAARESGRLAVADTTLLVGDSVRACLTVPEGWKFAEATPTCRVQVVIPARVDNQWLWEVTPKSTGDSIPMSASLTAILPGFGPKEFYSGTLTVRVGVAPCPLWRPTCLAAAVATWKGIITGLGAIAAAGTGLRAWLRRRRRRAAPRGGRARRPEHGAGVPT